jgi:hypothetical protein
MVRVAARQARGAVPVHDPPGGDVDDGEDEVVLLRDDDLLTVLAEEGVVRRDEGLPGPKVSRLWELPDDSPSRVDHQKSVVAAVGDQDRAWQHARLRTGGEVRSCELARGRQRGTAFGARRTQHNGAKQHCHRYRAFTHEWRQ